MEKVGISWRYHFTKACWSWRLKDAINYNFQTTTHILVTQLYFSNQGKFFISLPHRTERRFLISLHPIFTFLG